jgi:hypothetical protein
MRDEILYCKSVWWDALLLLCWLVASRPGACAVSEDAPKSISGNLLSLERMGAGAPAGWRVAGANYAWEPEAKPGPLGIGAARICFGAQGHLSLDAPARFMRRGIHHAMCIWLRSEPAGASVQLEVRDNDHDEKVLLRHEVAATEAWRHVKTHGTLAKGVKDRYFLTLRARGTNCTLWLDGLWLGESDNAEDANWQPAIRSAGVALKPKADWGLVCGNEPMRLAARVVGATQNGCRLHLRALHTNGAAAELPQIGVDDSGIWQGDIEVAGDIAKPFGMVRVEATVVGPDGRAISPMAETLLARAPEPVPGPLPKSPFGVHVSLREPDVAVAARLGYKWCRIHDANGSTKWGLIEPEPGKWIWHDDAINLARRHGLSILGMLDSSPPWESGTRHKGYWSIYGAPRNIDHWRNYVRQVVGHYAGRIDEWEVWNEPWNNRSSGFAFFQNGSPFLYVKLLIAAYQEAKRTNPKSTIVGIDTYPPLWDQWVLAMGALPYYDVLSWHRYEPTLQGRPDDSLARVSNRLRAEQAKHGTPKPILCSEGGPDVAIFHGSFFSFADPVLSGDWSRAADRYPRMFLSAIAAGNQRFIAYSIHNEPRYGLSIHMMVEPDYLLRPLHLTLAALAHFVEGAHYEGRLVPAPDISAHVFSQPNARAYANEQSTVVVLISDGEEAEDLPRPLPAEVQCYDRWGNPTRIPKQATRSPTYLVARGDAVGRLLDAMRGDVQAEPEVVGASKSARPTGTPAPSGEDTMRSLLQATGHSLAQGDPPLWTLFSSQGSVAVMATESGLAVARRAGLKSDPALAGRFRLTGQIKVTGQSIERAGELAIGRIKLAVDPPGEAGHTWVLFFSAVQDGPTGKRGQEPFVHSTLRAASRQKVPDPFFPGSWRYITLSIAPGEGDGDAVAGEQAMSSLRHWERAVSDGGVLELRGRLNPAPFCSVLCKPDGEAYWFTDPEDFATMLNQIAMWGGVSRSAMSPSTVAVHGNLATIMGQWEVGSPFFGPAPYHFIATLFRTGGEWRLAAMCLGAGS